MNGDITHAEPEPPSLPRKVTIERAAEGYGFNLHGEKGIHGQYISAIDDGSPAQKNDLRVGDRVIGVNNQDVEDLPHSKVVELIRAGGNQVTLLVVDEQCDQYYKDLGIKIPQDKFETSAEVVAVQEDRVSNEPENDEHGDVVENNEIAPEPVVVETPQESTPPVQEESGREDETPTDEDNYEEVIPKGALESKPAEIVVETPADVPEESKPAVVQETTTTTTSNGPNAPDHSPILDMAAARPKPKRNEVKRATQNWKQKYDDFNKL